MKRCIQIHIRNQKGAMANADWPILSKEEILGHLTKVTVGHFITRQRYRLDYLYNCIIDI